MSSSYVRTNFKSFLTTNAASEKQVDFTNLYATIPELLDQLSISSTENWLGIDFIGEDERPITIGSGNTSGKYRETGAIYLHAVAAVGLGVPAALLTRVETLRDLLRGQRIGNIIIESVSPITTGAGAALQFEGGYTSGSFLVGYYCDFDT